VGLGSNEAQGNHAFHVLRPDPSTLAWSSGKSYRLCTAILTSTRASSDCGWDESGGEQCCEACDA
jgi:hypothetical protein